VTVPQQNRVGGWWSSVVLIVAALLLSAPASAQGRLSLRGFGDVGWTTFAAEQSFAAVLGSDTGRVFGGGVDVVFARHVFATVRASRFRGVGQRVFLFDGTQFDLGIPTTIIITPLELTAGYRFDRGWRLVPYGGAGVSRSRYEETSAFAEADENIDARFLGYHVMGGAEVRLTHWLGAAVEAQWATVPDALGDDPNSVSSEFEESNLGGLTFRLKVVVGR
jgi:opacity protein-like surface antigen